MEYKLNAKFMLGDVIFFKNSDEEILKLVVGEIHHRICSSGISVRYRSSHWRTTKTGWKYTKHNWRDDEHYFTEQFLLENLVAVKRRVKGRHVKVRLHSAKDFIFATECNVSQIKFPEVTQLCELSKDAAFLQSEKEVNYE